jgi:hypothetical protein
MFGHASKEVKVAVFLFTFVPWELYSSAANPYDEWCCAGLVWRLFVMNRGGWVG